MKKFQKIVCAILLIATFSSCVPYQYGYYNGHDRGERHDRDHGRGERHDRGERHGRGND